jgi:undecaprenyl diphosphate synthase
MQIVGPAERALITQGDMPQHVGIIMDGCRRWSYARNLHPSEGYLRAAESVKYSVLEAARIGIRYLTFYAFSTENWQRPADELSALMQFSHWLWPATVIDALRQVNAKPLVMGEINDPRLQYDEFTPLQQVTVVKEAIVVTFAVNYGTRSEMAYAVERAAQELGDRGTGDLRKYMYRPELPDLDLVIRTSGEMRLSNFMLWHASYAELIFTDTLWPDFTGIHLASAIREYQARRRRIGR